MRLLGAVSLVFMVGFSTAFDDEEAINAERVNLHEALEENYDAESSFADENEKIEMNESDEDNEENNSYGLPPLPPWMQQETPWWFFLPPWMHPGFMPGAPPLLEDKYMRQLTPDDPDMPDLPPHMFPPPEFPPIDPMDVADDPMDDYPFFMDVPPMLEELEDGETLNRRKRETLMDTMTIHDPSEWWHDVDAGVSNAVTKKLAKTKTGIASQYMMLDNLELYGPALHLGEIDTGYLMNPELDQASDRAFGKNADFYLGDMDAFRFTPQGERFESYSQFKKNKGRMALGRRYILHDLFFKNGEQCWINKNMKSIENIRDDLDNTDKFVDPFLGISKYWHEVSCGNFYAGKYLLLAFREKDGNMYMYFQDPWGRQIAVQNPNFNGMQAASPYNRHTAIHNLNYPTSSTDAYYALQPDVAHINNHAYTNTGGRWGEDDLDDYMWYGGYDAPYDESQVWMMNTGRMAPEQSQINFKQKRYNTNVVRQPTLPYFNYQPSGGLP